jgi:hypothetical protein
LAQVYHLSDYRERAREYRRNGFSLELAPPFIIIQYYRDGVKTEKHRMISEHLLRHLLEVPQ